MLAETTFAGNVVRKYIIVKQVVFRQGWTLVRIGDEREFNKIKVKPRE